MFIFGKTVPVSYLKEPGTFVPRKSGAAPGRKTYTDYYVTSDMRCSVVSFDNELARIIAKPNITPFELQNALELIDSQEDGYIMFRGNEVKQTYLEGFGVSVTRVTKEEIKDPASAILLLDFDEDNVFSDITVSSSSSAKDLESVLLRLCPFLKGKRYLIQRSGSAGITHTIKKGEIKDYSKRLSLRVYVWLSQPYTCEQLSKKLKPSFKNWKHPISGKPWVDLAYFNRAQKTYVQYAELKGTTESHLSKGDRFHISNGDPVDIEAILKALPKPSKESKAVTSGESIFRPERGVAELVRELDELGARGGLDNQRGEVISREIGKMMFFNPEQVPLLVQEIKENSYHIFGGQDKGAEWLDSLYSYTNNKLYSRISCESDAIRDFVFAENVKDFHSIDMTKDYVTIDDLPLFQHQLLYRYIGLKSDCGTGKSKGNTLEWVNYCKNNNKVFYYITNTEANALKASKDYGIADYQKFGTDRNCKQIAFDNEKLLSLCYMSTHYFGNNSSLPKADVIYIDEASQVLRGWTNPEEAFTPIQKLFELCDRAERVILADADYDDELCSWFMSALSGFKAADACLYINNAKRAEGYKIDVSLNTALVYQDLLESLDAGLKVAVFIDDNDDNSELTAFCQTVKTFTDCNYKCFDKENIPEKVKLFTNPNKTIPEWFAEGMNMLVLSPWANIGWDYYCEGQSFDRVYILDKKGYFTPKRIWQIARRMRECRSAMVLLNPVSNLPLEDPAKKLLEEFKGLEFDDLDRLDRWLLKADDCLYMDNAVKLYSLVERLKSRGALPTFREPSNKEEERVYRELYEEFKEVKREIKKDLNNEKEIDEVLVNSMQLAFQKFVDDKTKVHSYESLPSNFEYITEEEASKHLKSLEKRNARFTSTQAQKILLAITSTPEERERLDKKYLVEYYKIMGLIMEGFISTFFPIVGRTDDAVFNFIEWYLTDPRGEWYSSYNFIDTNSDYYLQLQKYAYVNHKTLGLRNDFYNEPNRTIRKLASLIGCSIVTDKNGLKIGAVQAKRNLFNEMKSDPNFPSKMKDAQKVQYCIDNIMRKPPSMLTQAEEDFIKTRKSPFTLKRDRFVSSTVLNYFYSYMRTCRAENFL